MNSLSDEIIKHAISACHLGGVIGHPQPLGRPLCAGRPTGNTVSIAGAIRTGVFGPGVKHYQLSHGVDKTRVFQPQMPMKLLEMFQMLWEDSGIENLATY